MKIGFARRDLPPAPQAPARGKPLRRSSYAQTLSVIHLTGEMPQGGKRVGPHEAVESCDKFLCKKLHSCPRPKKSATGRLFPRCARRSF